MKKSASILDYSYPYLDPAIWDHDQKLYSYHKDFILRLLDKMYVNYKLVQPEAWITDIRIIGSLTTSKWLFTSDMDVHMVVDLTKFIELNMPGTDPKIAYEYLDSTRKEFDRAKILAPMTQHPIEYYFEVPEFITTNTSMVGIYSLSQDKWLKDPVFFDADLDFEESKKQVMTEAESIAQALDGSFGKIDRQIDRISELENIIAAWGPDKQQLFYTKIEDKLKAIEAEILKDLELRQALIDARHAAQNPMADIEIKFKWLQRFGFFGILTNIKNLMTETGGQITLQELPLLKKIVTEAAKRTIKNPGIWEGKKFWSGMADAHDGDIYEVHTYQTAEAASWHHSFYTSTEAQVAMRDGDAVFFWVDPDGTINTAWGHNLENSMEGKDDDLKAKIRSQISIVNPNLKAAFLKEALERQTLAIDFDDTIAKENEDRSIGEPQEGVKEALTKLKDDGYIIEIYSGRANEEKGADEIKAWLESNEIPYDTILDVEKPIATHYIDDRAIKFTSWSDVLKQVEKSDKTAALHVVARLADKYWIAPDGKEFAFSPTDNNIGGHLGWIPKNKDILKGYGIDLNIHGPYGHHAIADDMIQAGWTRVTTESDYDFAMEVADLKSVPSYLDNFVAQHYTGGGVEIDDLTGEYQDLEDPFPSLQKQINRARQTRLQPAAKAFSKKEITAKTKKVKQGDYSCIMAMIPHGLAQEIVEFGVREIPDEDLYLDEDGNLGRELQAHITILYGLLTDDAKSVRRSFNDSKPFKAKLGKVRHFQPPERDFDVVTVEVISDELNEANKMIENKFDCADDLPSSGEYKPHITVAYVKRNAAKKHIGSDEFEGIEVELDTLVFSPRKGNKTYFSVGTSKESSFVLEKVNKFAGMEVEFGYWVDPKGNIYDAHGEGLIHNEWVLANLKMLRHFYGIKVPKELFKYAKEYFKYIQEGGENADMPASDEIWNQMLQTGWVRVGDADGGLGVELNDLRKIPSFLENILAQDLQAEQTVMVEDINHNSVAVEWPWKNLQQAVNRALGGQTKKADFLPSLVNAPDNDWQFAAGGDDKEIPVDPDAISDGTTEYEPCTTGKPRSKDVWRQFLSMFSNLFSKGDTQKIEAYDKELEEANKDALGEDETALEYSKGFYDPKKHDFPHNTTWDSLTQDGEPSKPTSVTYSPQISNEDNLDQNSPGGYPRRFMGKPKGEYFSNEGEVNNTLIQMLRNRTAVIESTTTDITKEAYLEHAYWIAPDGKVFEVRDAINVYYTHYNWINDEQDMLKKEYGIQVNQRTNSETLIKDGWIRVGDGSSLNNDGIRNWQVEVADIKNIPSSVDNVLAQFVPEGAEVEFADVNRGYVMVEYPFKSAQAAVHRALRMQQQPAVAASLKTALVKQYGLYVNNTGYPAIRTMTYDEALQFVKARFPEAFAKGAYQIKEERVKVSSLNKTAINVNGVNVIKNPSIRQIEMLLKKAYQRELRGVVDPDSGDLFVWDAYYEYHWPMIKALGINVPDDDTYYGYTLVIKDENSMYSALNLQQQFKKELSNRRVKRRAGSQSASVPDYLIDEWKTEQINNNTDEEPYVNHDQRDYPYGMHDSPENTGTGIGWPQDNTRAVVRLDTLENPAFRLDPFGIGEYNVTYYTGMPASDGIEKTNPD